MVNLCGHDKIRRFELYRGPQKMALFSRTARPGNIVLADRARDAGNWERAAHYYRAALVRNSDTPPIWVQFGHALKESGHLAPAEAAYRRAIEDAPGVPDTHLHLGHVLKLRHRKEEALAAYLCALALDPDCDAARRELVALGSREDEVVGVAGAVRSGTMLPAQRQGRTSTITLADRARAVGQWEEAARFYRKALDRNPHRPEIWVQYGHMLKESGKLTEAEMAYRTALDYEPTAADAHLQLGHVLKILGHNEAAMGAYLRAFAVDPRLPGPLAELHELGWTDSDLCELRWQVDGEPAAGEKTPAVQLAMAPVERPIASLVLPDPSTMPDRGRLRDYLIEESGQTSANRTLDYFRVVEAVRLSNESFDQPRRAVLRSLLARMSPLARAAADRRSIDASIIVPVYNHIEYTVACVISLLEHRCDARFEVIIADDGSTDETRQLFGEVGGVVRCITTPTNGGFLKNCNFSAKHAGGTYLVLLNNDTFVLDDWLDELIAPFNNFKNIGLVGSKLLMADGTLQEAGGIVWRDGSGWNFGRGQDPRGYQFNYVKDTDYASGAAIALPRALWEGLHGFDERYAPAYCEDTDLAFEIRARGLRTLYSPRAQVIHHEGVSHGTDITAGYKAYQVTNQEKFVEKWRSTLEAEHCSNGEQVYYARDRSKGRRHILVIDHYVPKFDRDGGSRMMYDFLRLFADAGLQVLFWPENGHYDRSYAQTLQGFGVEILYGVAGGFHEWIKQTGPYLDYVFLHRPHTSIGYIDDLCKFSAAKRLFYGADLHFRRFEREYALTGRAELIEEIEDSRRTELYVWQRSDVIYYPASEEVALVQERMPDKPVRRFPVQVYSDEGIRAARNRVALARPNPPTILFVAGFSHRPNADALLWFVREVQPFVKMRVPECVTIVAGSFPPRSVTSLACDAIVVTEAISWPVLDWFYHSANVVIAPMRYGGGMKGKILEAMRYGVPVVATSAGAEGFDEAEEIMAVADAPDAFADHVVKVLRDPDSATRRVLKGLDYVEQQFSYTAVARRLTLDIPELERIVRGGGLLQR